MHITCQAAWLKTRHTVTCGFIYFIFFTVSEENEPFCNTMFHMGLERRKRYGKLNHPTKLTTSEPFLRSCLHKLLLITKMVKLSVILVILLASAITII